MQCRHETSASPRGSPKGSSIARRHSEARPGLRRKARHSRGGWNPSGHDGAPASVEDGALPAGGLAVWAVVPWAFSVRVQVLLERAEV